MIRPLALVPLVLSLVACDAFRTAPPPAPAAPARPTTAPVATADDRPDEYLQLIQDFSITGEQRDRILAKRQEFKAGVAALDASPVAERQKAAQTALDAAKKAHDPAKLAPAQAEWDAAHKAYMTRRGAYRAAVFNELTPAQKAAYASQRLQAEVRKDLRKANMTEDQLARLKGLCDTAAPLFLKPDTFTTDPYLFETMRVQKDPIIDTVRTTILTPEQRAKVSPRLPETNAAPK
jgi:hypothetical protein